MPKTILCDYAGADGELRGALSIVPRRKSPVCEGFIQRGPLVYRRRPAALAIFEAMKKG